ncbi:MAG: DNA repair protein [Bacilli bacterium]|nr:DNA repair protein [Bacilli bacterium]
MNKNNYKNISKKELLEIMILQSERIEELEKELAIKEKKLNKKEIVIKEAGSIAEATVKLNEIFEHAQQVADDYVFNVKKMIKKEENKKAKDKKTSKKSNKTKK